MINVVISNESVGKSYKKANTILAKYFPQMGQKTFSGFISEEGMDDVFNELKKASSKYMSVCCVEQINKHKQSVLWIVGNKDNFDPENGFYAMKTKSVKVEVKEYSYQEKYWLLITKLAALFHDVGKFNIDFQEKLTEALEADIVFKKTGKKKDYISFEFLRHEAVSALVFFEFIKKYKDLEHSYFSETENVKKILISSMKKVSDMSENNDFEKVKFDVKNSLKNVYTYCHNILIKDNNKKSSRFNKNKEETVSQVEQSLAGILWIILTHHKLINVKQSNSDDVIYSDEFNIEDSKHLNFDVKGVETMSLNEKLNKLKKNLTFKNSLMMDDANYLEAFTSSLWALINLCEENKKFKLMDKVCFRVALSHYARPTMILGDYIGSIQKSKKDSVLNKDNLNIANLENGKKGDTVTTHLKKVSSAVKNIHKMRKVAILDNEAFAKVENFQLRDLKNSLINNSNVKFKWQNDAYNYIYVQSKTQKLGNLVMVISETGSGKTLAGAKIMHAIQKDGLRFTLGLGLRTLTIQGGEAYRKLLGLNRKNLAVILGSTLTQKLENKTGSSILDNDESLIFDVDNTEKSGWVNFVRGKDDLNDIDKINENKLGKLIDTPVVVSTVDQFIKIVNLSRPSALKMLPRVFSSDLILDEIDSYSPDDLIEILKLIYLYAIYGRNVIIMSATVNKVILESIRDTYEKGYDIFQKINMCENKPMIYMVSNLIETKKVTNNNDISEYLNNFTEYQQSENFKAKVCLNKVIDVDVNSWKKEVFEEAKSLHCRFKEGGVSVGFLKFNSVKNARLFANFLMTETDDSLGLNENLQVSVLCYHSKYSLLELNNIEKDLAQIINRKEDKGIEKIRREKIERLKERIYGDKESKKEIMIIVSTTSILEVGRDHDYDYAIIEPSTNKALIQTSGRVMRHRECGVVEGRVSVLSRPLNDKKEVHEIWKNIGVFNYLNKIDVKNHSATDYSTMFGKTYDNKIISSVMFSENGNEMRFYEDKVFERKINDDGTIISKYKKGLTLNNSLYQNWFRENKQKYSILLSLAKNITRQRINRKILTFDVVINVGNGDGYKHEKFEPIKKRIYLDVYKPEDYISIHKDFSDSELFELTSYELKSYNEKVVVSYHNLLGFNNVNI